MGPDLGYEDLASKRGAIFEKRVNRWTFLIEHLQGFDFAVNLQMQVSF